MKAERDACGNLVVTNIEVLIRILLALFVVGPIAAWLAPIPATAAAGWTALCCVFGLALFASDERATFVFDRSRALVSWRRDRAFRHDSGEIPFASISALALERDFARWSQLGGARRLVLLTSAGPVPVTSAFTGIGEDAETIGRLIQSCLRETPPGRAVQFKTG